MHPRHNDAFVISALLVAIVLIFGAQSHSTSFSIASLSHAADTPNPNATLCDSLTGASSFAGRNMPEIANGGRVSTFGGPSDTGVSATEGLALSNLPGELFLPANDPRIAGKGLGQARRLNPDAFYVAARWPYTNAFRASPIPASQLGSKSSYDGGFPVLIEANGRKIVAWAVDYGPHGNTTDKDIDLSPGAARALGLRSGDTATSISYVTDPTIRPSTCSGTAAASTNQGSLQNNTGSGAGSNPTGTVPGGTLWMTTPLCFKHMGPAGAGRVSKATSCNSGFATPPGSAPIPVADCGIGGVLCTIPTGCLNLNCKANNNAIFDPITKTCGCG